ncbi:MFS transporter [Microbacterium barkeri]|uniref:MFS transporter n=1 Tax=Microbacterium barkeri TaxID=33917 RepID=A0A9W6LW31_9MICO|nr:MULTISPECIES: MFS transporter [Microbacterium]MDI6943370.1 MFS transporter [Microbacterium barkeri]MDR6878241.1 fucose permease [Microbacterium barkeri]GLJ61374.1 MFS transporter [Microbacterium barkeri]
MTPAIRQRRNALFVMFLLPGIGISSWVTRTPDVQRLLGARIDEMGFILFGLSVGSMIGILSSGALVARFGTRPVIAVGTLSSATGVAVVGLGAALGIAPLVAVGLGLFGLGMGGAEVALNVEGAEVEQAIGRSVMPLMHGFFSLGTVVGAVAGMLLTAAAFPVAVHLAVVAALIAVVLAAAIRNVPSGIGRRATPRERGRRAPRAAVWRDPGLLLVSGIILALAMAEGTAGDWLPILMVEGHGVDAALGSGVYAIFAVSMTVGRFAGGRFVDRFGRPTVLAASALLGAIGLAVVIFVDSQAAAAAAVVLWGLGTSLGFPLALSVAGDSGEDTAARVSFAATIGYVAFLVGPPVLGLLGEHFGLRAALIVVLALVAVAIFLAPGARTPAERELARR